MPEKRTKIRIKRSRVADGECLQRRGVEEDDDDVAEVAAEGMAVLVVARRWWCMLRRVRERERKRKRKRSEVVFERGRRGEGGEWRVGNTRLR